MSGFICRPIQAYEGLLMWLDRGLTAITLSLMYASAGADSGKRRATLGGFGTLGAVYHD